MGKIIINGKTKDRKTDKCYPYGKAGLSTICSNVWVQGNSIVVKLDILLVVNRYNLS